MLRPARGAVHHLAAHWVLVGTCEAEIGGEVVKHYFRGHFFGELALENYGESRRACVRATHQDGVRLLKLNRKIPQLLCASRQKVTLSRWTAA